jgi:hypothetical protein
MQFNLKYFLLALALFIIEVLIALYVHDAIVRPYIGDVLVVMLIYCFVKAFFNVPVLSCALWVLVFAYVIELTQYFKLVKHLGLQHSTLASTVMGTSFAWTDMLAYTAGFIIILIAERKKLVQHKLASKS